MDGHGLVKPTGSTLKKICTFVAMISCRRIFQVSASKWQSLLTAAPKQSHDALLPYARCSPQVWTRIGSQAAAASFLCFLLFSLVPSEVLQKIRTILVQQNLSCSGSGLIHLWAVLKTSDPNISWFINKLITFSAQYLAQCCTDSLLQ